MPLWDKPSAAWLIEADKINIAHISDAEFTKYFIVKSKVREFLESNYKKIIKAPKGYGKTLFLRKKTKNYIDKHKQNVFPSSDQALCEDGKNVIDKMPAVTKKDNIFRRDYFIGADGLSNKPNLSRRVENLITAWRYAIIIAANKYITGDGNNDLTLSEFSKALSREPNELNNDLAKVVHIDRQCFIFIDNIDALVNFSDVITLGNGRAIRDTSYIPFWSAIQLAFCIAVLQLPDKHIHVFGAVKHEALSLLDEKSFAFSDRMKLDAITTSLDYEKDDIEKIFYNNIALATNREPFSTNEYRAAITNYYNLSSSEQKNSNVENREESTFDYLYRHSLYKPRDILAIGDAIKDASGRPNSSLFIKKTLHSKPLYKNIVWDYLTEIGSVLKDNIIDELFQKTTAIKNILTDRETRKICAKYNQVSPVCDKGRCSTCERNHIFCYLYNAGLLGIAVRKSDDAFIQKFQLPHERQDVLSGGIKRIHDLDGEKYFFMHPLLTHRKNSKINNKVIVGEGKIFYTPVNLMLDGGLELTAKLGDKWQIDIQITDSTERKKIIHHNLYNNVEEIVTSTDILKLNLAPEIIGTMISSLDKLELNDFGEFKEF